MTKDIFDMSSAERSAEAKKWEKGISFEETRPLSKRSKALWEMAKRGRGRPAKPANQRVRRVLISIDPQLFNLVESFTAANGLDRSKLFSLSVQAFIAADEAHRQAIASGKPRQKKAG